MQYPSGQSRRRFETVLYMDWLDARTGKEAPVHYYSPHTSQIGRREHLTVPAARFLTYHECCVNACYS